MRTVICVVTFIVLLLAGFLATPGVFKVVNPEYLLALREYGQQLTKLAQDATNTDLKMTELRSNISKLERSAKDSSAALTAKQASMKLANASADEIATVTIEAASKLNGLGSELEQLNTEMAALKETKAGITSTQAELKKKLDTAAADSANIYVVARALALGAIGALMSIFAKYLAGPAGRPLFEDSTSLGRMWASIAMGELCQSSWLGCSLLALFRYSPTQLKPLAKLISGR